MLPPTLSPLQSHTAAITLGSKPAVKFGNQDTPPPAEPATPQAAPENSAPAPAPSFLSQATNLLGSWKTTVQTGAASALNQAGQLLNTAAEKLSAPAQSTEVPAEAPAQPAEAAPEAAPSTLNQIGGALTTAKDSVVSGATVVVNTATSVAGSAVNTATTVAGAAVNTVNEAVVQPTVERVQAGVTNAKPHVANDAKTLVTSLPEMVLGGKIAAALIAAKAVKNTVGAFLMGLIDPKSAQQAALKETPAPSAEAPVAEPPAAEAPTPSEAPATPKHSGEENAVPN